MDTSAQLNPTRFIPSAQLVGFSGADLRAGFDERLTECATLDIALSRVRLATLGSLPDRLQECDQVRVVLGAVRAHDLDAEAHALSAVPGGRARVASLGELLSAGRVLVRAAPLGGWSPDFSLFHSRSSISAPRPAQGSESRAELETRAVPGLHDRSGARGDRPGARELTLSPGRLRGLVGSHAFGGEGAGSGPLLAVGVEGAAAERLRIAFEEIWARSHDVTPALSTLFRRALRWSSVPRLERLKSVDT